MRFLVYIMVFFLFGDSVLAQNKLARTLKKFNTESVPYAHVYEITEEKNTVLLDARKKEEYNISHLKAAIWVGYQEFEQDSVSSRIPDKNTPIIVYCSIGVRSEDIGEKLKKAGYTNVKNLYGGIFEWKNKDKPIYNTHNLETDSIHAFDKQWGKLLNKGIKVYDIPESVEPR